MLIWKQNNNNNNNNNNNRNFTGNLDQAGNTTMFFILEEVNETISDFLQDYENTLNSFYFSITSI